MSNEALPFMDRVLLAHESLVIVYEERDSFLSDDDVLDAAEAWTTDSLAWANDGEDEGDHPMPDYVALRDALFAMLIQPDGPSNN